MALPNRRTPRRLLATLALAAVALAVGASASPASAGAAPRRQGGERIETFEVDATVRRDGSIRIRERIRYDFGGNSRRGIQRFIPTVFPWTGDPPEGGSVGATYDRVTPVVDVSVSSPDAPDDLEVSGEASETKLRIGDPDVFISGVHDYTITYTIEGVLNGFDAHDELYLNVTGNGWEVPIGSARATIEVPGSVSRVACFAGQAGSQLPCGSSGSDGATATFAHDGLGAGEGMTVVVAMPKGQVTDPDETRILRERWSIGSAFRLNGATGTASGLVLAGGLGAIGALGWRRGRDRRYAGSAVDAAFGNATGEDARVPLFDSSPNTVEFVPPEGIRPGHMGTLWDETAHHLDVSAMIVDLAVRGWLRIDELEPQSKGFLGIGGSSGDYRLVQLRDPDTDQAATELWHAEKVLLQSLFAAGDSVELSDLRTKFADKMKLIQSALYDDAVAAHWFPTRPDRVRGRWIGIGVAVLVLGAALVFLAARFSHLGLVALPVPLLGVVLIASSGRFPHRTAKGTALLGRVRGFKELFDAGEGERQRFAEQHHLFAQYLPYAIVFGCTDKWAEVFAPLGLTPQEMGLGVWYTSPYGYDPIRFGYAMNAFSTHTAGSLAAAAPSSSGGASSGGSGFSGGFSGGGFGGGGGGSW